jgi:hypothetical protein
MYYILFFIKNMIFLFININNENRMMKADLLTKLFNTHPFFIIILYNFIHSLIILFDNIFWC